MSGSGAEIFIGVASGVGTTAIVGASAYVVRKVRRMAARIEEVMATPAELASLRPVVANNTIAISDLSKAFSNLTETFNRLSLLMEKRASGD